MFSFAVCDDERKTADDISDRIYNCFVQKNEEISIMKFSDGNSLLGSSEYFDAVFLDVKMPAPDGRETAHLLRNSGFDGFIIFITVLEDYVYDSFEVSPFDFIVKPINAERFQRTLVRLKNSMESRKQTVMIRTNDKKRLIRLCDIVYCEVLNRQIYIHTKDGETVSFYGKIEDFETSLNGNFFKCHRSFIVNLNCIKSFSKNSAEMSDGSLIPISRLRKKEFERALIKQMRE